MENKDTLAPELELMIRAYQESKPEVAASKYWIQLNERNVRQICEKGFENFKQTVARNYFTSLVELRDPQVKYLAEHVPAVSVATAANSGLAMAAVKGTFNCSAASATSRPVASADVFLNDSAPRSSSLMW